MLGASLVGAALATQMPLTSSASFTHSEDLGGNIMATRPACASGQLYASAVLAENPSFLWRFGETTPPAVTTVGDSSSNGIDGTVDGTGIGFGPTATGLIECDDTYAADFPGGGSTDFIVAPTAVPNPDTFTLSAWVKTNSSQGGWILGMGSARWGSSTNRDRVLYLRPNGQPEFSVGIGPRTVIEGPNPINDDTAHLLVATLGPAGMVLYVDGQVVAADNSVTSGASYSGNEPTDPPPATTPTPDGMGYWRVGYDSTAGFGATSPSEDQLHATIDTVAVWQNRALTPAEVSDLYAQNHW